MTVNKVEFVYIPLIETLQCLIGNTSIYEQVCIHMHAYILYRFISMLQTRINLHTLTCIKVMDGHAQRDGTLRDFCDGSKYQKCSLFSSDKTAFQLILYYDELELCNPLGAHRKKHKIGNLAFYK